MSSDVEAVSFEWIEHQLVVLTLAEQHTLMLYRFANYVTLNVIDDAAMLAFGLS